MNQYDERYKSKYLLGRTQYSSSDVVHRFNDLRFNKANKEFVFVEGSSDATFYKNTSISILKDSSAYIFANYNPDPYASKGKKVVYDAFYSIRKDEELRYELDKCLFIIDKDYEFYKKERVFTITEGHSMECYFLERDNIEVLFSYYKLPTEEVDKFWALYENFAGKCYEFFALKGTWSYMCEESKKSLMLFSKPYKKKYDYREIFQFTFNDGTYTFNEDKLNEEIKLLRDMINANKNFQPYYQKLYTSVKDNPQMIRGHDAFEFLKQYLLQIHNITINDNLRELIPVIGDMAVNLDIKQISTEA